MKDILHKPSEELLRAICRPECLHMGPVIAPSIGIKVPLHLSFRRLFSFPETLEIMGREMGRVAAELKPDALAALEMAGVPIATSISLAYKIPMVVVRKEKKEGARFSVEGVVRPGMNYIIIDDAMAAGGTKKRSIEFIEETGGRVNGIVVILAAFEVWEAGYDLGMSFLEEKGIKIHYFIRWQEWWEAMHQFGYVNKEWLELEKDFLHNIKQWQTDEKKWEWFEEVKTKLGGKFI